MLSCFSRIRLFATLWTVAHQASLSMGFSRQEYWIGLPCSPPGDLPDSGIESSSLLVNHFGILSNIFSVLLRQLCPLQKWCITLTDLRVLKQPYISGINLIWLKCTICFIVMDLGYK